MDLNILVQKILEQSVTAAVLFVVLMLFAKWCKWQILNERADKDRCFDLHESMRDCVNTQSQAIKDQCSATQDLARAIEKCFGISKPR